MKDLRIETSEDWPELLPRLQAEVAGLGMDPRSVEITAERTTGTFTLAGTPVRERMFTATVRKLKGDANDLLNEAGFGLLQFYYHAPEGELAALDGVLGAIARSFRIDPGWQQRQNAQVAQGQAMSNHDVAAGDGGGPPGAAELHDCPASHLAEPGERQPGDHAVVCVSQCRAGQRNASVVERQLRRQRRDQPRRRRGAPGRQQIRSILGDQRRHGHRPQLGTQPDRSWHHLEPIKL
jgi:hypothetical protein